MDENQPFILPSDSEKLSHKFILDAILKRQRDTEPPPDETGDIDDLEDAIELDLGDEATVDCPELQLPADKPYFRIGEVAELIGVEPHVLRYWESEFPAIRPSKSGGQRVYRRKDVETLHLIRHLLHVEKFSIKGAKRKLQERRKLPAQAAPLLPQPPRDETFLKEIATSLRELIRLSGG